MMAESLLNREGGISLQRGIIHLLAGLLAFTLFAQIAQAHGMSEADKQAITEGGNLIYLWIGATHMLTGYDHLAFVFGIIFFLSSFRDIVKYVSAFTIGHSITLIYATFNAVQLNYFLIDAMIGLSVSYIAFANLDGFRKYLSINPPNMMVMIVGLGLIHGFGLSTRLQELPLDPDSLLLNIISFNIGIELGQVAALAIMLALIAAWRNRHSFKAFSLIANYSLIFAGGFLFLMQMHDYSHDGEVTPVAVASESSIITALDAPFTPTRTIKVTVPARDGIEYKVLIDNNASIQFAWHSDSSELYYDFHGDPKAGPAGSFQSYQEGSRKEARGTFTAPFDGKHGWYWKNSSNKPVEVTLELAGAFSLMNKAYEEPPMPMMEEPGGFMDIEPAPVN